MQIDEFITSHFSSEEQASLPHYVVLTEYAPEVYLPYFYNLV